MKTRMTNEIMTGIVVVAAIAVGFFFFAKTNKLNAAPFRVKTTFNYAEGVKKDSLVKFAGIDVGRVESVNFTYNPETKIELVLAIDRAARLREDSLAFVATSGMIGDAYVGITSGSPDKPFLKEGDLLMSEDPIEARKLMKKADKIAENLNVALADMKKLTESVTGLVSDNKVRIENITANLESTTENFKEFSADIKKSPWKLLMKK
mgnify:CR=1 FL=1